MPVVPIPIAYGYAIEAGFTPAEAVTIVAIAIAESGLNSDAVNINPPDNRTPVESHDRGILQINDYWHKDVTDACAFDPKCAFQAAYVISDGGTSFWAWRTFQVGAHGQYMGEVQAAIETQGKDGNTVSIEVPATWISQVSEKLGIPDPTAPLPEPQIKTYTVVSGDTLYGIAAKLHGDGNAWPDLYQANKDVIGPDPGLIRPDEILTLPEGW